MVYVTVSITADVVAYRFVNYFYLLQSSATIIFPLTYVLGDITCEVYGWSVSMKMVWFMLACEAIFAALIALILHIPTYGIGQYQSEYKDILGNMWLFVTAGITANAIASLLNIYFISKWKIFTKGKVFWIRSILSTCISEFMLVVITVAIAFTPIINVGNTARVFLNAYLLEIFYAFLFVYPATILVKFLKKSEGIDAYDYDISYNPFKIIEQ